jgi:hypothetical protein
MTGRKLADRADVEVGATSKIETGSEPDWTITPYRRPACSRPLTSRGARRAKTSPRTQRLHVPKDLRDLCPVLGIMGEGFSASARSTTRALSSAASIKAARRAAETEVPSCVSAASARCASSSGRKVMLRVMLPIDLQDVGPGQA